MRWLILSHFLSPCQKAIEKLLKVQEQHRLTDKLTSYCRDVVPQRASQDCNLHSATDVSPLIYIYTVYIIILFCPIIFIHQLSKIYPCKFEACKFEFDDLFGRWRLHLRHTWIAAIHLGPWKLDGSTGGAGGRVKMMKHDNVNPGLNP